MSIEQAKTFRDKVNADPALQDDFKTLLREGKVIDLATFGQSHGFNYSNEESNEVFSQGGDELSDFELEMVQAACPGGPGKGMVD